MLILNIDATVLIAFMEEFIFKDPSSLIPKVLLDWSLFNYYVYCLCSFWYLMMAFVYLLSAMKVHSSISLRAACEINMKWLFMKLLQLSSIFLTVLQESWHLQSQVSCIFDSWLLFVFLCFCFMSHRSSG